MRPLSSYLFHLGLALFLLYALLLVTSRTFDFDLLGRPGIMAFRKVAIVIAFNVLLCLSVWLTEDIILSRRVGIGHVT
jgi:hypothetical protein